MPKGEAAVTSTELESIYPQMFVNPLLIMYVRPDAPDYLTCAIHPRRTDTYADYGMMVCDIVRHIANAFGVPEAEVWRHVEKERRQPTTTTTTLKKRGL
jgi:hypothetical protein